MKNLKLLRQQKKISQQKLADILQVSQQSVYKYENDLAEPDFDTLKKLADYFDTSIDYITGYSENPFKITLYSETALNPDELEHLRLYRALSPKVRALFDSLLTEYYNR